MTWYSIGKLGKEELAQRKFGPTVKTGTGEAAGEAAVPATMEVIIRTETGKREGRWHWHW